MSDAARLLEDLQSVGIIKEGPMGERRDKGRRQRHKARYGPKPTSGAQVRAAFKRARQGLGELSSVLLRSDLPSTTGSMEELNYLITQLGKIERTLGVAEDAQEEEPLDED
jgi:hypothetical protein